jgi:hypothetical protein
VIGEHPVERQRELGGPHGHGSSTGVNGQGRIS